MTIYLTPNGEELIILLRGITWNANFVSPRSTTFFYIGASAQLGQLLSSPIVYATMRRDVWIPMYLGFGLFVTATILCTIIPSNTDELKRQSQTEDVLETRESDANQSRGLSNWTHDIVVKLGAALYWVAYENRPIGYMLLSLLITVMAKYAASLELQYITKRYDLSWETVSISPNFVQHNLI